MEERNVHPVEKPPEWDDYELEKLFLFCILDRVMSYEKVCAAFDQIMVELWEGSMRGFENHPVERIAETLKATGYRFPNQTARHIKANTWVDGTWLKRCSREDMIKHCKGIGMKLASMFLVRTRPTKCYAIIDVHIKRWLKDVHSLHVEGMKYEEMEAAFLKIAEDMGRDPEELDYELWDQYRVGNRKENGTWPYRDRVKGEQPVKESRDGV